MKYRGYTLEELSQRYNIRISGEEKGLDINRINATLIKYFQEINNYIAIVSTERDALKIELNSIDSNIKFEENKIYNSLTTENFNTPKDKKLSDKSRETTAFLSARTPDIMKKRNEVVDKISFCNLELEVWNRLLNNVLFISKKLENNTINIASELKAFNLTKNINRIETKEEIKEETSDDNDEFLKDIQ